MKPLCGAADILLPNISEACFLTGVEYKEEYDKDYIMMLLAKLSELGCKKIVLTGVGYRCGYTGIVVYENGKYDYYEHERIAKGCHGTGDVYASAFVGSLLRGMAVYDSASIAADYTVECIKATQDDQSHWYGVKFELALPYLINRLNK